MLLFFSWQLYFEISLGTIEDDDVPHKANHENVIHAHTLNVKSSTSDSSKIEKVAETQTATLSKNKTSKQMSKPNSASKPSDIRVVDTQTVATPLKWGKLISPKLDKDNEAMSVGLFSADAQTLPTKKNPTSKDVKSRKAPENTYSSLKKEKKKVRKSNDNTQSISSSSGFRSEKLTTGNERYDNIAEKLAEIKTAKTNHVANKKDNVYPSLKRNQNKNQKSKVDVRSDPKNYEVVRSGKVISENITTSQDELKTVKAKHSNKTNDQKAATLERKQKLQAKTSKSASKGALWLSPKK